MVAQTTHIGIDPETGTKYTIGFSSNSGSYYIVDIDIPAGVICVKFSIEALEIDGRKNLGGPSESVHLLNSTKRFPDVEEIFIDEAISSILIPNSLFPNVRHVISKSAKFMDNVPYLVNTEESFSGIISVSTTLLNAFELNDGETISLAKVSHIQSGAFKGCGAARIVDVQNIQACTEGAFNDVIIEAYKDENGDSIIGTIFAKANPESKTLRVLPDITCVADGTFNGSKATRMELVNDNYSAFIKTMYNIPETVEDIYTDIQEQWQLVQIVSYISDPDNIIASIEVTENSQLCRTIDGILYSKDGKELLACPALRPGHVDVPEGVLEIGEYAFGGPGTSSITLPQSLQTICNGAFLQSGIEEIDIPTGVKKIEEMALMTVKEINIPGGKPINGLISAAATTNADAWWRTSNENAEYCYTTLCVTVKIGNEAFAMPRFMRRAASHDFVESWDRGVFNKDLARKLFEASTTEAEKQETAVAEVKLHPDNQTALAYVKETADIIIDRYIRWERNKELAEFLRLNFANRDQLAKSVDSATKNKNETAKAYILAALEDIKISTAKTFAL